jgi:hypothetical protein
MDNLYLNIFISIFIVQMKMWGGFGRSISSQGCKGVVIFFSKN